MIATIIICTVTPLAYLVGLGVARGEIKRLRDELHAHEYAERLTLSLLGYLSRCTIVAPRRASRDDVDRVVAQVMRDERIEDWRRGKRVEGWQ
jgi:hypothetical protein